MAYCGGGGSLDATSDGLRFIAIRFAVFFETGAAAPPTLTSAAVDCLARANLAPGRFVCAWCALCAWCDMVWCVSGVGCKRCGAGWYGVACERCVTGVVWCGL